MALALFILWVIFNGRLTAEVAAFGAVFAVLLTAFACRFLGYSLRKDWRLVRGLPKALRYGCMLIGEVVKANLAVMRMILTRGFEPDPQLVRFASGLQSRGHRVALADSITLTPGTITASLEGDRFVVHCLDASLMKDLDRSCFVRALTDMEAQAEPAADALQAEPLAAESMAAEPEAAQPAEAEPEKTVEAAATEAKEGEA